MAKSIVSVAIDADLLGKFDALVAKVATSRDEVLCNMIRAHLLETGRERVVCWIATYCTGKYEFPHCYGCGARTEFAGNLFVPLMSDGKLGKPHCSICANSML